MAVTRLERKHRKNRARANNRKRIIKQISWKPTIRNVDVEAIKKEFAEKNQSPASQKEEAQNKSEESPAAEEQA